MKLFHAVRLSSLLVAMPERWTANFCIGGNERQTLSMVFNKVKAPAGTIELRPGPLRLSMENRTDRRVLPSLWMAAEPLHDLLRKRKPYLTAKRLLTPGRYVWMRRPLWGRTRLRSGS